MSFQEYYLTPSGRRIDSYSEAERLVDSGQEHAIYVITEEQQEREARELEARQAEHVRRLNEARERAYQKSPQGQREAILREIQDSGTTSRVTACDPDIVDAFHELESWRGTNPFIE